MKPVILIVFIGLISACNPFPDSHWTAGVPDFVPFVQIAPAQTPVQDIIFSDTWNVLDQMTPANREHIYEMITSVAGAEVNVQGIALFPHSSDDWMPVWILQTGDKFLNRASGIFSKPYTETSYKFRKALIFKLFLPGEVILYAVQIRQWLYVSESSKAIEETVRTFGEEIPSISVPGAQFLPGNILVNAGALDQFATLEAAVRFRPLLSGATRGAGAAELRLTHTSDSGIDRPDLTLSGPLSLGPADSQSNLVRALTSHNHRNVLDRFVSQDAALAVFMNQAPEPDNEPSESVSRIDRWLAENPAFYRELRNTLGDNFAFAGFASSGLQALGEYAFIRITEDRPAFVRLMGELSDAGLITAQSGNWLVQGKALARLISGNMSTFDIYYVTMLGDAVAVTQRPGLGQKLQSDHNRRRVLYYNEGYLSIRESFDAQISGFVYAQNSELIKYVQSLLNPANSVDLLLQQFSLTAMAFNRDSNANRVQWNIKTWQIEQTTQPVEERWLVTLDGTDLSGPPVLANIGGSSRDEVIVATRGGLVVALAADGTQVFRVNTGNDQPVGSPIVYDWYSNGQMVILLAAGNRIHAWNNTGTPLPNFPIQLAETVSAPIQIGDVTRNGLPEIVVATSDRKIHVLDQRGNNITGWPQNMNAIVSSQPLLEITSGQREIIAYAENVVFAWNSTGIARDGFPVFNRAPLRGDLLYHRNHILAGSADGAIVAIGRGDYFSPDFGVRANPYETSVGSNQVQLLEIANSPIVIRPEVVSKRIMLQDSSYVTEPVFFAATDNGSVFVLSQTGALRFTESFGQVAMSGQAPLVADLRRNGGDVVMAIAGFGRLYGWDLQTRNQFLNLPTVSLQKPVISDLIANGRMEIIAGTRDGLRCWTINR
jgi:hypothetical protein